MQRIVYQIQKEFLQLMRDKQLLPMIIMIPVIQLVILANAATFEINEIELDVIDLDRSPSSRQLISKLKGSGFFNIVKRSVSGTKARENILKDNVDASLEIPAQFEADLNRQGQGELFLQINAINQNAANLINVYLNSVINDFAGRKLSRKIKVDRKPVNYKTIDAQISYWFNPEMNYKYYMVPGILSILVTIIGMFLTSMTIVKEKEVGTIEQVNVTPVKKVQFISGKLIPVWIIGMLDMAFGLLLGKLLFNIPIVGSIFLIFLSVGIYLIVALGFGLLISTVANTQQQAMFVSFFFMIVFILMSGLFTPLESMPEWAQKLDLINPLMYFIKVMRMLFLKGSSLADIHRPLLALLIYGGVILGLANWRYRKTQ